MKRVFSSVAIVCFIFISIGEVNAQNGTENQKKRPVSRFEARMNLLEFARTTNNVNYTDTYDRSMLMYASANFGLSSMVLV